MQTFKVGDLVRVVGDHYKGFTPGSAFNLPRKPGIVEIGGEGYIMIRYEHNDKRPGGFLSPAVSAACFELAVDSPVKTETVTTTKLIHGTYGRVHVGYNHQSGKANVGVCDGNAWTVDLTAAELRAAAKTFIEIAEYVEGQK